MKIQFGPRGQYFSEVKVTQGHENANVANADVTTDNFGDSHGYVRKVVESGVVELKGLALILKSMLNSEDQMVRRNALPQDVSGSYAGIWVMA